VVRATQIVGTRLSCQAPPASLWLAALALVGLLAGCTSLGPDTIRAGRPAYNDAILATNDEMLLQNIVRLRFGDSIGFLTVSSITAQVSMSSSAAVGLGFGSPANYAGNLVPFAGTVTSGQNPTISYSPVAGDRLLRQTASETPLDLAILLISGAQSHQAGWQTVVRRVNNMRNPDFVDPPLRITDPRFEELAALAGTLQDRGMLYWVRLGGAQTGHAVVLHGYSPAASAEVARLLILMNVAQPMRDGDDIVIPVRVAVGSPDSGAISIETRSILDLMRLAAAGIELAAGSEAEAVHYAAPGLAGKGIRIHSASARPANARVAVEYRGRWYYIDNEDAASKQWFMNLLLLASAQLPSANDGTPVLTIPVGNR
jgi:hypothetical protein